MLARTRVLGLVFVAIWLELINLSDCVVQHPLLLISFDGFRADKFNEFINKAPDSNFSRFIRDGGVRAPYMKPSFPSLTFPNHITLITGLHPESHGIVANSVYDPVYDQKLRLAGNTDLKWWSTFEPIWLTAKKQQLKTATSFWVSNDVYTRNADIFLAFNKNYNPYDRVNELVSWFQKFSLDLALMYFDEPDATGHTYGPDSVEYEKKIAEMDALFGHLINQLRSVGILNNMNIIVVSDHGMTTLKPGTEQFIYLQNYADAYSLVNTTKSVFSEVSNIFCKSEQDVNILYEKMQQIPHLKTYLKESVPNEFHYRSDRKIGQLVAVADEGYKLTDSSESNNWIGKGAHGYNNSHEHMRAIFFARGPNFKPNQQLEPFQNVDVYSLLCTLLEIKCNPSNGTFKSFETVYKSNGLALNKSTSLLYCLSFVLILFKSNF